MTVPPDTPAMLWEMAKIIVGVSVTSLPPLLVWIGRLLRRWIKEQEKLIRLVQGEEGQDGLIQRAHSLETWKIQTSQELAALTEHVGELLEWQYRELNGVRKPHTKHHPGGS